MTIDIVIIDSGVNPWHSHVRGVAGGIAFGLGESGKVVASEDFFDSMGHGTAIAGVIREQVSRARLHAVRIFHGELKAPVSALKAALEWAVKKRLKMIHLSLGTEREEHRHDLDRICRQACQQDIVIVAAARTPEDRIYPGTFESVIGVCWERTCSEDSIVYHPGKAVEFGACGKPRQLPGVPEGSNFRGSSFAAARVTGMAARMLEQDPQRGTVWVREALKRMAEEDNTNGDRQ